MSRIEEALVLERLNDSAEMNVGTEQEHVQNIAHRLGGGKGRALPLSLADRLGGEAAVLASCYSSDRVAGAGGKEVGSQLSERGAVDLSELHLQQHFLCADRTESKHVDHVLRISGG